jgi:hypothetical protein
LVDAFRGQDAVVNCITGSATQYEPSKLIVDAAVAAGVKFFFANEFVSNLMSEQARRLPEEFAGAKARIRWYLEELAKEGKISWTSLNGGPMFDLCKSFVAFRGVEDDLTNIHIGVAKGPAGFDIAAHHARIYGTGAHPLHWTPLPVLALAASNMLRNPSAITNRAIYVCPFIQTQLPTQSSILAALERVLDTKFTVEHVDVAKINKHARIALERGEGAKAMKGLAVSNQFYEGDSGNDFGHLVDNKTVGVEGMSVEDAVRDVVGRFGPGYGLVRGMLEVEACEV